MFDRCVLNLNVEFHIERLPRSKTKLPQDAKCLSTPGGAIQVARNMSRVVPIKFTAEIGANPVTIYTKCKS